MRHITACFLLLFIAVSSFAQQTNPNAVVSKEDYLQKSQRQKTTSWILLGAGAALAGAGLILGVNEAEDLSFDQAETHGIMIVAGGAAIVASIPFFIASDRNKRKAAAVTGYFEFRKEKFNGPALAANPSFPAVAITLKL